MKRYLSIEHCQHPELGFPIAALTPDIARSGPALKKRISATTQAYRARLAGVMPGKNPAEQKRNLMLIFSAMLGATVIARTLRVPGGRHARYQTKDISVVGKVEG